MRIGIDLGGTKIEGVVLDGADGESVRLRRPTPRDDYVATIEATVGLVAALESEAGARQSTIGIGMPGSISPATGRVQNANSTWLNGKPFQDDISLRLSRPVRCANDANCFALSEAIDGAAAGARIVFGVILGTGCGGGVIANGKVLDGPRGITGEWGHNPLPRPTADEYPGPVCWCGRLGCMETWVSGPGFAADHARVTGQTLPAEKIVAHAGAGDRDAAATLARHASRLARGLASIINVLDPDVIVLGGGLSRLVHLYDVLPDLIAPNIFADNRSVDIRPPKHGDASGVRGAARLWDVNEGKT